MAKSLPERIACDIQADYIDSRVCAPSQPLPSVRTLKDRYATTITTVCAAIGLLESRGRVQKVHGKGNFVTDAPTGAAWSPGPKVIGLMIPRSDDGPSMVSQMANGVEREAARAGYRVMVASLQLDYEDEHRALRELHDAGCAGVVLNPMPRTREQLRNDFLANEFEDWPIVLLDMAWPEQQRSMIVVDNYRACRDLTDLLIRQGHERIAFMDWKIPRGELMSRSVRDRYRGYLAALDAAGLTPRPEDVWAITYTTFEGDPHAELGGHVRRWADAVERPTAAIGLNDGWAMSIVRYLREIGLESPRDLAVAGFDNDPMIATLHPEFPTTDPDFARMGELAAEMLLQEIRGEVPPPVHCIQPARILRRAISHVAI